MTSSTSAGAPWRSGLRVSRLRCHPQAVDSPSLLGFARSKFTHEVGVKVKLSQPSPGRDLGHEVQARSQGVCGTKDGLSSKWQDVPRRGRWLDRPGPRLYHRHLIFRVDFGDRTIDIDSCITRT
ncbi:hypothetical protein B296_00020011 [Ensete ventricosum]|uniref:Uncharacterized protein n=1 Tax=Ensete ventricosum TaxID=4639 RepID=A0A426Z5I6_ENSVE|nr:hypothetical protein B296_00020011 [Ensete ventricosum]